MQWGKKHVKLLAPTSLTSKYKSALTAFLSHVFDFHERSSAWNEARRPVQLRASLISPGGQESLKPAQGRAAIAVPAAHSYKIPGLGALLQAITWSK